MNAVILDDEPMVLALLRGVLGRRGYSVEAYSTPIRCPLYSAPGCPCEPQVPCPDVILTDFDMPLVNGIEFVEHLKMKGCKCRHIALISGLLTDATRLKAQPLGVTVFAKPFQLKGLTAWLADAERDFA